MLTFAELKTVHP